MGSIPSVPSSLVQCLETVCNNRSGCVAFAADPPYLGDFLRPFDLDKIVWPRAIIRPKDAYEVAEAVQCAATHKLHVQARSGGHSYGNFGVGGSSGGVCIDMVGFKNASMDNATLEATFGPGLLVVELAKWLDDHGRAISHGTNRGDGIGGQALVGGLGPMSRMWGTTLDHILEVEVVTASGKIVRASERENEDLFWALRGAGSSFGIVTQFKARTNPVPPTVVEYIYEWEVDERMNLTNVFLDWQEVVADPKLDRRFSTNFVVSPGSAMVMAIFYGTRLEFEKSGIPGRMPAGAYFTSYEFDWLGHLNHTGHLMSRFRPNNPAKFRGRTRAFRDIDLLGPQGADVLMRYLAFRTGQATRAEQAVVIFSSDGGGAVADMAQNATAYPHRDTVMMYQSHIVDKGRISIWDRWWIRKVDGRVLKASPNVHTAYAAFGDRRMDRFRAQAMYWRPHLKELKLLKRHWDPNNVFKNPHSIEPAKHWIEASRSSS